MRLDQLYKHDPKNTRNDPILVNPRGAMVQVPESRVEELLKKGFKLVNKNWQPSWTQQETPKPKVEVPKKLHELKEEAERADNILEVEEI